MSPKTTETPSSGEEVPVRPRNSRFDILSLSVIISVDPPNRRSHTVFLCIRIFVLKHRIDLNYHINCVKCRHFIPSSFSFRQLINAQKNRDKNVENAFVSCKKSITNFFASVNAAFRWKQNKRMNEYNGISATKIVQIYKHTFFKILLTG